MKIVIDTNVVIAAFATRGLCKDIFEICLSAHTLVVSNELLDEMERKLEEVLRLPPPLTGEIIEFLSSVTERIKPARVPREDCRDPDDLHVLGAAVAAEAEVIITGDRDLLSLNPYKSILILSPRAFWEHLRESPSE